MKLKTLTMLLTLTFAELSVCHAVTFSNPWKYINWLEDVRCGKVAGLTWEEEFRGVNRMSNSVFGEAVVAEGKTADSQGLKLFFKPMTIHGDSVSTFDHVLGFTLATSNSPDSPAFREMENALKKAFNSEGESMYRLQASRTIKMFNGEKLNAIVFYVNPVEYTDIELRTVIARVKTVVEKKFNPREVSALNNL